MPICYEGETATLRGQCGVAEIDELVPFLERHPDATVSLDGCQHMHTAVFQLLRSRRTKVTGTPDNMFILKWLYPLLHPDSADETPVSDAESVEGNS